MKDVCSFALLTGARMSEILGLTWDDIDLNRKAAILHADKTKSGKARSLPLNDEVLDIILSREKDKDCAFIFHSGRKEKMLEINRNDFNNATKILGIKDFTFHDLRHTWASWHVQGGTPLYTLKHLGGWESVEMVKKYAHLALEHLGEHINNVTFMSHSQEFKIS